MRIISSFSDYMDPVMREGIDLHTLWLREKRIINPSPYGFVGLNSPVGDPWWRKPEGNSLIFKTFTVGFCGKLYAGFEWHAYHHETETAKGFCYEPDSVDKVIAEHGNDTDKWLYFRQGTKPKAGSRAYHGMKPNRVGLHADWQQFNTEAANYLATFLELKAPVFVDTPGRWIKKKDGNGNWFSHPLTVNERLADYGFQHVFDPYRAFQEISMFISGTLGGNTKTIPNVSDADMIVAKGFDKWSFRKEPTKKKR